jgi:peptidoglycan/LPS O-acetylase OafA/YrhL
VALGFGTVAKNPASWSHWISTVTLIRLDNFLTPISPAWTLFHEVAFYAAFALLIAHARTGLAVFAVWQLTCLFMMQYPLPVERTPYVVYLSTYNVDFGIGMAAYLLSSRKSLGGPFVWIICGLLPLLGVVALERRYGFSPVMGLAYGLSFGAIIVGSVVLERQRQIAIPVLPFIGNASYSIYLAHESLASLFAKLMFRSHAAIRFERLTYILIFGLTVGAGCAIHFFVERPLLQLSRQALRRLGKIRTGACPPQLRKASIR